MCHISPDDHDHSTQIKVEYIPIPQDAELSARWLLAHTPRGRRLIFRVMIITFGLPLALCVGIAFWNWYLAFFFLLLAILVQLIRSKGAPRAMIAEILCKKIAGRATHDFNQQRVIISLDNKVLQIESEKGVIIRYPLDALTQVEKTIDGLFFSKDGELIRFIPLRAFPSSLALDNFCQKCLEFVQIKGSVTLSSPDIATTSSTTPIIPKDMAYRGDGTRKSRLASVSLACGIAAVLLLLFLVPAVIVGCIAVITGILAFYRIRRSGGMVIGKRSALWGISLGACSSFAAVILLSLSISLAGFIINSLRNVIVSAIPVVRSSNIATSLFNAAGIVEGCRRYAVGHSKMYPPHLSVLLITHACTPQQLCDPGSSTVPLAGSVIKVPESEWRLIAHNVDAACDFIYVGDGLEAGATHTPIDSDLIVVYSYDVYGGTGRVIAFADENARFVPTAELPAVFAACNAARAKFGLAQISLDAKPTIESEK